MRFILKLSYLFNVNSVCEVRFNGDLADLARFSRKIEKISNEVSTLFVRSYRPKLCPGLCCRGSFNFIQCFEWTIILYKDADKFMGRGLILAAMINISQFCLTLAWLILATKIFLYYFLDFISLLVIGLFFRLILVWCMNYISVPCVH